MATLNITETELNELIKLKDQGKVTEAWAFLGSKGDAYAYLASKIVASDTGSMSPIARMFYEMVRSQWENTVGAGVWGGSVFDGVAKHHLGNYLKFLQEHGSSGAYVLPNTIQIETSYRDAVTYPGLSPLAAIDSMFSVLDTFMGGDGNGGVSASGLDFSWAQFMNGATLLGNAFGDNGPTWETDRIWFNSEVFKDDVDPITAAITLGRTAVDTVDRFGGGMLASLSPLAPAYWAIKLVDGVLDFNILDFADRIAVQTLFNRIDKSIRPDGVDAMLDAVGTDDRAAFGDLIDRLAKTVGIDVPKSDSSRKQIFENVKTISDSLGATPGAYSILSVVGGNIAASALAEDTNAIAYRYALQKLNPFVVIGADYSKFNGNGELDLYNEDTGAGSLTKSWIEDRSKMLGWLLQQNQADQTYIESTQSLDGAWLFRDESTSKSVVVQPKGGIGGIEHTVWFGSDGESNLAGGDKTDRLYGMGGDDKLIGQGGDDYLEGGNGNDNIDGGEGKDQLLGGAGNDQLTGGTGADTLLGGDGFDTYYADNGDTIFDSDGQGEIYVNGKKLGGASRDIGGNTYVSKDGSEIYHQNGDGTISVTSHDSSGDSQITMQSPSSSGSPRNDIPNVYSPGMGIPLETRDKPADLDPAKVPFANAKAQASPIILDLDGDGVETVGVSSGAYFDHEGDGFAEQTGWVGKDDGLLVWDRNGDGVINDGGELFGDHTKLADGSLAANGFVALSELDSNQDGKVDSSDIAFSNLRIWQDVDGNGISAPGELFELSAVGVQSIATAYQSSYRVDQDGNVHRQLGSYTRVDGTTGNAEDVWFKVDRTNSIATDSVTVPEDISALPYLYGYGVVRDLDQAMTTDASGELKSLVLQFSLETSVENREKILESILFKWSGADGFSPSSRGYNIGDARKLYAVEAFLGEPFLQGGWGPDPGPDASALIRQAYQKIFESFYVRLVSQTALQPIFDQIGYKWNEQSASFVGDLSQVTAYLENAIAQDRASGKELLSETARVLKGLGILGRLDTVDFRQSLEGLGADVTVIVDSIWQGLVATGGNDNLIATSGNDGLIGLGGNDTLYGLAGNDVFNGGSGDDMLIGEAGNDTYLFERGFGQDTISDYDLAAGNADVIRFLGDIAPSEIIVTRDGASLYVGIDGTQDRVKIENWFVASGTAAKVERVEFSDGTVWSVADLESRITARPATELGDVFYGGLGVDEIHGLGGNDIIYGNAGDDVISGDAGDDYMEGGVGNDTYLFGRGHGQDTVFDRDSKAGNIDTVRYLGDIAPSDVLVRRDQKNLYLEIQGGSDRITLKDWFVTPDGQIEKVEFFDGTVWTLDDLNAKVSTPTEGADFLCGTSSADVISGGGGDDQIFGDVGDDALSGGDGSDRIEGGAGIDTLSGGGGNDSLYAGSGNDTYLFGRGAGQDTVYETDGVEDRVLLDADVLPSDVRVTRDAWNNLTLSIHGTPDKLVVSNWFSGSGSRVEKVEFSDGTVWDSAALINLAAIPSDQDDYIVGTDDANVIDGLQGNDEISGGAGADVLTGGGGNDVLCGGTGNDVYVFRRGDGQDKVYDEDRQTGNTDTIQFGPDILPDDIKVLCQGRDLVFAINSSTDRITIQNWYDSATTKIEQISFANGVTWSVEEVAAKAVIAGTDGTDTLYGTIGNDVFDCGAGNDVLYGYNHYSGQGNDVYVFGVGDGDDTIADYDTSSGNVDTIKLVGLKPSEVSLSRGISGSSISNDLVISINGTTDKLTVQNYFVAGGGYKVEKVVFDDGTEWNTTVMDVAAALPTVAGVAYGTSASDVFDLRNAVVTTAYGYSSSGNDSGNDTYIWGSGGGQDVINDYGAATGNVDTIKIVGKTPSEVSLSRGISGSSISNDLVISINGTTDKLTVQNYFVAGGGYKVEKVVFDDGTVWDTTVMDVAAALPTVAGVAYGTSASDVFDLRNAVVTTAYGYSSSGNDSGNDTYIWGSGGGQDVISDYGSTTGNVDTVKLVGLKPTEVSLSRGISGSSISNDLVISINGTTDKLTVQNYFVAGGGYKVEKVVFDDGTVWDTTVMDVAAALPTVAGVAYGTSASDVFDLRNAVVTTAYGYSSSGNDSGNDTYIWGSGGGQDVINDYGAATGNVDTIKIVGKTPSEVSLSRGISGSSISNDLVISINGTTDKLTVQNYFVAGGGYKVEKVVFDDGTVWDTTVMDVAAALPTVAGVAYGTSASDVFDLRNAVVTTAYGYSSSGNDSGNDTYIWGSGGGQDVINDYGAATGNVDTIKIVGKTPSEVSLSRGISGSSISNDLVISINGTTDKLTVQNYFVAGGGYKVEKVVFDDGTEWNTTVMDVAAALPTVAGVAYGTSASDVFDLRNAVVTTAYGYSSSGNDSGNDTYIWGSGGGQDVINDYGAATGNVDTIKIVGKTPSEVSLSRGISGSSISNDLVISINGTTDKLTVQNYFVAGGGYKVEKVVFDDGTVWDTTVMDVAAALPTVAGVAYGTSASDVFDLRNAVATTAYGYSSSGNDSGNDTYIWGSGGGQDVISDYGSTTGNVDTVKLVGLKPTEVSLSRGISGSSISNDLVISINGTTDKLTVQNYFVAGGGYKVEKVVFDDGTVWDTTVMDVAAALPTVAGVAYGTSASDVFDLRNAVVTTAYGYSSSGNDSGNDTYIWGSGGGQDVISDYGSTTGNVDTVKLVGLKPTEVSLSRGISGSSISNDLVISINGTTDKLTVQNYFVAGGGYKVEKVVFDDGTVWDTTVMDVAAALPTVAGVAYGTSASDVFDLRNAVVTTAYGYSSSGNDSGNDTYIWGSGGGQDVINDYGAATGNVDTIKIVGKTPSEVSLSRGISGSSISNDLVISINGTTDKLTVQNYFVAGGGYKVEKVVFDDGTEWNTTVMDVAAALPTVAGVAYGTSASDVFDLRNAVVTTAYGYSSSGNDSGNDTYIWGSGGGQDVINDYGAATGNVDTIKIVGKTPSEVSLSRGISGSSISNDLVISINGTTDKLTVQNYFVAGGGYKVEKVVFDDGTVWDTTVMDVAAALPTVAGVAYGTSASDVFDLRNAVATTAYGYSSSGNDSGNDTYIWGSGGGQDVISDYGNATGNVDTIKLVGLKPSEVSLSRAISGSSISNDLVISIIGSTDTLTVTNYFADSAYKIEKVVFDDGTEWNTTVMDVAAALPTVAGVAYGTSASDVFDLRNAVATTAYGYSSNSYNSGNDTYIWGTGGGQDAISDYGNATGNVDTIKLVGLKPSEVSLSRAISGSSISNDLVISINGTTDKLTIQNYFADSAYKIEKVVFDDGTEWDTTVMDVAAARPTSAPILGSSLFDQAATEGLAFSYAVPADAFSDPDAGDVLVLSATLADGTSLPEWLSFDAATGTMSGTPPLGSGGTLNVRVTAKDGAGLAVSDILDISIKAGNQTLTGSAGVDVLTGGAGNDKLNGLAGDDTLIGGAGTDLLYGGAGADVLEGDPATSADAVALGTLVVYAKGTAVDGIYPTMEVWVDGVNVQTFTVGSANYAPYEVSLPAGINAKEVAVVFTNDASKPALGQDRNLYVDQIMVNGQPIKGNAPGVILDFGVGASARDGINTYGGYGTLNSNGALRFGLVGSDLLDGGAGADTMRGGIGNDVYVVDDAGDTIEEGANAGHDVVKSSVSYTLSGNLEDLNLLGTGNLDGTGNAGQNMLVGNGGANRLDGRQGVDMMVGGLGNDTYVVSDAGDGVYENAKAGTDLVESSIGYTLTTNVENLTLTGTASIKGTGNTLDNIVTGNAGNNVLNGGTGNDTVLGGVGDDTLLGGTGRDLLYGGVGNDVLEGDPAGSTDTEALNTLVINAKGSAVDNIYPTMEVWIDGAKTQTLTVGSSEFAAYEVTVPAGTSAKEVSVVFTNDAWKLELGQDRNLYVDSIEINGQPIKGNAPGVILDFGNGASARDGINTYGGYGTLNSNGALRFGLVGSDLLDGGAGADTMRGGIGNDVYVVDATGDTIVEGANAGHDLVKSSVSYALSDNVENLHLQGSANLDGTGNAGQNMLVGNSGANRLDGGQGMDLLVGGKGDDTYQLGIGSGQDTLYENDTTAGNTDIASFLSGITADQIWFRRVGNNLEASIIGTSDKLTVSNWYSGAAYHVEQFKTADGKTLLDSKVDSLVQAMASFAPPAAGQTTLPGNYQTALESVIAANWQ